LRSEFELPIQEDILAYRTKAECMANSKLNEKQYNFLAQDYLEERAQILIAKLVKFNDNTPEVIQIALGKLTILNFIANQVMQIKDAQDYTLVDKIENCLIKAKMMDNSTWDDTTCEGTSLQIDVKWVMAMEATDLYSLLKQAEATRDKINMREHVVEANRYQDFTAHIVRMKECAVEKKEWNTYSEVDGMSLHNEMKADGMLITVEQFDNGER